MKKFKLSIAILFTITFISSISQADENAGWYGGLSVGSAFENFDLPSGVDTDDSIVLGAQLGFRYKTDNDSVHPALEFKFRWFDDFDVDYLGSDVAEVEAWSISLRPKVYFGNSTVQPYLLAGVGWMDGELSIPALSYSVSESDLLLEVGGGIEFMVGSRTSLFIEADYLLPQGDLEDFEVWEVGAGLNIRF